MATLYTHKDARFYFANLGADMIRCVVAAQTGDEKKYEDSLSRARKTLSYLRKTGRHEAYEEGLLLLRALSYAKANKSLESFAKHLNRMVSTIVMPA